MSFIYLTFTSFDEAISRRSISISGTLSGRDEISDESNAFSIFSFSSSLLFINDVSAERRGDDSLVNPAFSISFRSHRHASSTCGSVYNRGKSERKSSLFSVRQRRASARSSPAFSSGKYGEAHCGFLFLFPHRQTFFSYFVCGFHTASTNHFPQ